jgi:hypothetical protein
MKSILILIWVLIAIFAAFFVFAQLKKGTLLTPREFKFFLFGLFMAGFPHFINMF